MIDRQSVLTDSCGISMPKWKKLDCPVALTSGYMPFVIHLTDPDRPAQKVRRIQENGMLSTQIHSLSDPDKEACTTVDLLDIVDFVESGATVLNQQQSFVECKPFLGTSQSNDLT